MYLQPWPFCLPLDLLDHLICFSKHSYYDLAGSSYDLARAVSKWININNEVSEFLKWCSFQCLPEKMWDHLSGMAVIDGYILGSNLIGDKEVPDVEVLSTLAARCSPMRFWENRSLVVLVNYRVLMT